MRPYPDRFYPIVDDLDWLARLAPLGIGTVQLRAKDRSPDEALRLVTAAVAVTPPGLRLVVNDYWEAAIAAGAAHLHLGQEDLAEADVPAIRRAGLTLGISTHDEAELETALRHDPDYVALGPIYPTTLKAMRFGPQGLDRIGDWKRRVGRVPLVAIGGITLERGPGVFAAGADSIAVVSDVTGSPDPAARVRAWLALRGGMIARRTAPNVENGPMRLSGNTPVFVRLPKISSRSAPLDGELMLNGTLIGEG